jgi:hypothetical protein
VLPEGFSPRAERGEKKSKIFPPERSNIAFFAKGWEQVLRKKLQCPIDENRTSAAGSN